MTLDEFLEQISGEFPPITLNKETTALVLIDMQVLALSDFLVWEAGIDPAAAREALKEYDERFQAAVERAQELLSACRGKGIRPVHVRIEALTGDAADTGPLHKKLNFLCPPDSRWVEWIPETAPLPGEAVLPKTCSGAVVGTMLERVLRNMGIKQVLAMGFYTDQCVETTVRDLADCGFEVTLVTDATATQTVKRWQNTMENMVNVYCGGETSASLRQRIAAL